jgi:hypothetical protein
VGKAGEGRHDNFIVPLLPTTADTLYANLDHPGFGLGRIRVYSVMHARATFVTNAADSIFVAAYPDSAIEEADVGRTGAGALFFGRAVVQRPGLHLATAGGFSESDFTIQTLSPNEVLVTLDRTTPSRPGWQTRTM